MPLINHILSDTELTQKTKDNILRKSVYVDEVQYDSSGIPLFSWIDINLTELCNRRCTFCPRVDPGFYPNQNLFFSNDAAKSLANELKELDYKGSIVLCGYGEPFMHPDINAIVSTLSKASRLEIVTNGDFLRPESITAIFEAGLDYLCISLYDGPHQVEKFKNLMHTCGIDESQYILRDRWHTEEDHFGLKLTNRSGVLDFGPSPISMQNKPCYYLSYSVTIDWNGDILLCVQDWNKKVKLGNINNQSLHSIWINPRTHALRTSLISGDRSKSPCNKCNADGTIHGFEHANSWRISSAA